MEMGNSRWGWPGRSAAKRGIIPDSIVFAAAFPVPGRALLRTFGSLIAPPEKAANG